MNVDLVPALSLLLDEAPERVAYALEVAAAEQAYLTFRVRRSDKTRRLHVPVDEVAEVHRKLLRRVLYGGPVSRAAYGGVPGRTFVDAARHHLGDAPAEVLTVDVRDAFFHTTRAKVRDALDQRLRPELRVLGLRRGDRRALVDALTDLVTVPRSQGTRCLPQGGPCSMALFNLVWQPIDRELFAQTGDAVRYTRYVDDLVFSSREPLPERLAERVGQVVARYAYRLQPGKTRLEPGDAAAVHGLRWEAGGLSLSEALARRCAHKAREQLRTHRTAPLPSHRRWAADGLRSLDRFLRPFYDERGRARPADLAFEVPPRARPAPTQAVDVLWP